MSPPKVRFLRRRLHDSAPAFLKLLKAWRCCFFGAGAACLHAHAQILEPGGQCLDRSRVIGCVVECLRPLGCAGAVSSDSDFFQLLFNGLVLFGDRCQFGIAVRDDLAIGFRVGPLDFNQLVPQPILLPHRLQDGRFRVAEKPSSEFADCDLFHGCGPESALPCARYFPFRLVPFALFEQPRAGLLDPGA